MPTLFPADESTIGRNAAYGDTGLLTQSSLSFRLIFTCIQTSFLFSVTRGFRPSLCTTRYYFFHTLTHTLILRFIPTLFHTIFMSTWLLVLSLIARYFFPLTNTRPAGPTHDHISRYIFHVAAAFAGTVVTWTIYNTSLVLITYIKT